ncbi:MAG: sigma-54-dependent Fis family transcriptional regulator [Deltaproteobacteria bacterium]|nr:sigma-54-dependent Fis family transcriptional regulator [Deltaproteobacteria bacterium]
MKTRYDNMAPTVLVVDDEAFARRFFETILEQEGYACRTAETAAQCRKYLESEGPPDLLVLDVRLPDGNAVNAMKLGAFDFITKPFEDANKVKISIKNAVAHRRLALENRQLRTQLQSRSVFQNMVGESKCMQRVFELIEKSARVGSHILIEGESGTGKDLVAEAIHNLSEQRDGRFVPVNCAALSESLLESALFGYEKGAFTGAQRTTPGFFEEASGGTLFLDEIGDASLGVQAKILRAVEEGAIYRVGRTKPISVNARLIFATHKDLSKEVAEGRFRQDLYYRINIIKIHLPPLRERKEDIPLLVQRFMERYASETGVSKKGFENGATSYLMQRDWPGNVRELKNFVERVMALHPHETVTREDLRPYGEEDSLRAMMGIESLDFDEARERFEQAYFETLIAKAKGDLSLAAEYSGKHVATIYRKIKALGIKMK